MIFVNDAQIKPVARGTVLLRQGEVCRFGCKVIRGCLKSFATDATGKEHIMQFAPEDWLITDMNSLCFGGPAEITIDAIEDSEVYWMEGTLDNFLKNADRPDLVEQINLLTRNIIAANKRTRMLLSSTAEQRYLDFLKTYPTLVNRLPLKLIASYAGITPEYLSEIRRKIARRSFS